MNELERKVALHAQICEALTALYECKNRDYNDAFAKSYAKHGLAQTVMRLTDKLNRLDALTDAKASVSDETVEDTLMDIANYSIMTLIERLKEDENG